MVSGTAEVCWDPSLRLVWRAVALTMRMTGRHCLDQSCCLPAVRQTYRLWPSCYRNNWRLLTRRLSELTYWISVKVKCRSKLRCTIVSQADPGGEGKHRAQGRRDWESGKQRGPRCLIASSLFTGAGQCRKRVHDSLNYFLHIGISLTPKFWTFHPSTATLSCQGDR